MSVVMRPILLVSFVIAAAVAVVVVPVLCSVERGRQEIGDIRPDATRSSVAPADAGLVGETAPRAEQGVTRRSNAEDSVEREDAASIVRGRVVSSSGRPLAGAVLVAREVGEPWRLDHTDDGLPDLAVILDDDGGFRLPIRGRALELRIPPLPRKLFAATVEPSSAGDRTLEFVADTSREMTVGRIIDRREVRRGRVYVALTTTNSHGIDELGCFEFDEVSSAPRHLTVSVSGYGSQRPRIVYSTPWIDSLRIIPPLELVESEPVSLTITPKNVPCRLEAREPFHSFTVVVSDRVSGSVSIDGLPSFYDCRFRAVPLVQSGFLPSDWVPVQSRTNLRLEPGHVVAVTVSRDGEQPLECSIDRGRRVPIVDDRADISVVRLGPDCLIQIFPAGETSCIYGSHHDVRDGKVHIVVAEPATVRLTTDASDAFLRPVLLRPTHTEVRRFGGFSWQRGLIEPWPEGHTWVLDPVPPGRYVPGLKDQRARRTLHMPLVDRMIDVEPGGTHDVHLAMEDFGLARIDRAAVRAPESEAEIRFWSWNDKSRFVSEVGAGEVTVLRAGDYLVGCETSRDACRELRWAHLRVAASRLEWRRGWNAIERTTRYRLRGVAAGTKVTVRHDDWPAYVSNIVVGDDEILPVRGMPVPFSIETEAGIIRRVERGDPWGSGEPETVTVAF